MEKRIALIGFGEASSAFAEGAPWADAARAYDRKTDADTSRNAKRADYARAGVVGCGSAAEALDGAGLVLSAVTADQALAAAEEGAPHLGRDALWCDLNSVAPETKRAAAGAIHAAGGRYVDAAVMAPVHSAGRGVPLLVAGPHAEAGAAALRAIGFASVRIVAGPVGAASAIKMIRSVMVKGIEALSAECVIAAERAGVRGEVVASLDASWPGADWARRFDYNLDRMLAHGMRRAAEMEEAAKTLISLGTAPAMTRGTIALQRAIGELGAVPPEGLDAKLGLLLRPGEERAA